MLGRLPIRIRLTVAFAAAMVVVLALTSWFVYVRVAASLDGAIDVGLRSRADDVAALVQQADSGLAESGSGRLNETDNSFAQVLRTNGTVLDSTPGVDQPALTAAELRGLGSGAILQDRHAAGIEGSVRLLARPVLAEGQRLVIVVGVTLSDREEALTGLLGAFAIGGPIAVLLASGIGYLLASFGLAPVERMRRRAEQVTLERSGERLPLPEAVDEIHRLGETLNAMLARLEQSFERERAFVADASHELRTPLAVLKAELEVTLRGGGYEPEVGDALRSAFDEVDQLSRLAEDLLLIARAQDGRLSVMLEPVDLAALLEGVIERWRGSYAAAGREVLLDIPPGTSAAVDPLRVRQAVGNLLDNALRYGDGPVTVLVLSGENLQISVTDRGSGFTPEFAPRAFERFSRASASRGRGGAGLGLAIVEAVARAHGGEARISTGADGRTEVSLVLPRPRPGEFVGLAEHQVVDRDRPSMDDAGGV